MKRIGYVVGLLLISFRVLGQNGMMVIGTPASHDALWTTHTERLSEVKKINERVDKLNAEIHSLAASVHQEVEVTIDEFETSGERRKRVSEMKAKQKQDLQAELARCAAELKKVNEQVAVAKKWVVAEVDLPKEVVFVLNVRMGRFDADKSSIQGFTFVQNIPERPGVFRVDDTYPNPAVFDFGMNLEGLHGVTMNRELARKLRDASDQNALWVGFKAKPKPVEFQHSYCRTNVPFKEEVKKEGYLDSPSTMGLRFVVSVLGGDASAIEEPKKTKIVTRDVWESEKIIRTGWTDRPTPEFFYRYDKETGALQQIQ